MSLAKEEIEAVVAYRKEKAYNTLDRKSVV